jgi:hypothetical protein
MAKICPAKILLKNDDWHATPQTSETLACFKFASIKKRAKAKKNNKNNDIGLFAAECYFAPLKPINDCIKEPP